MDVSWILRGQYLDIEDKSQKEVGQGQNLGKIGTKNGHIWGIFWTWDKTWTKHGTLTLTTSMHPVLFVSW